MRDGFLIMPTESLTDAAWREGAHGTAQSEREVSCR